MTTTSQRQNESMDSSNAERPLRMSERLNLVLGARLDLAIELVRRDTHKPAGIKTVNACTAKMVLVSLVDFHGQDGHIYPSVATIAEMACTSERTVIRVIQLLEHMGVIQVTRRHVMKGQSMRDRTNWYVIDWGIIEEISRLTESVIEDNSTWSHRARQCQSVSRSGDKLSPAHSGEPVTDCHLSQCQIVTCAGVKLSHAPVTDCRPNRPSEPAHLNRRYEPPIPSSAHSDSNDVIAIDGAWAKNHAARGLGWMATVYPESRNVNREQWQPAWCLVFAGVEREHAELLQRVIFGNAKDTTTKEILLACGWDVSPAESAAERYLRSRIVSVLKSVVTKIRKGGSISNSLPSLMQSWLRKSKPHELTEPARAELQIAAVRDQHRMRRHAS